MTKCTWEGCSEFATTQQTAKDGQIWAKLCAKHDKEIDDAIKSGDPKPILSTWIKAQGGSKAAAKRMMGL